MRFVLDTKLPKRGEKVALEPTDLSWLGEARGEDKGSHAARLR